MDREARIEAAVGRHRDGDLDAAEAAYSALLAEDPDDHRVLSVSAILEHQRGRTEEAMRRLHRAVELAPEVPGHHNNLGNLYRLEAEPERALDCYRRALALEPTNVESMCNLGTLCRRLDLVGEAREILEAVRAEVPGHPETNHNLALIYVSLGMEEEALDCIEACHAAGVTRAVEPTWHARILARFGRRERAIEMLERVLAAWPDDPEVAYELKAMRGEALDRAPDAYVRRHFDGFAEGFDHQLARLDYRAPELVGGIAAALAGGDRVGLIVDLGCGTGLLAPHLRPLCHHLVGFDLSPRMLKFAERRGGYDELAEVELTEALRAMPRGAAEMATAADTLCYFGRLDEVFAGLAHALRPGGAFVGTVEWQAGDDGPRVNDSGRYTHGEPYLRATAEAAGLALRIARVEPLRLEFGEQVQGLVFALENAGR